MQTQVIGIDPGIFGGISYYSFSSCGFDNKMLVIPMPAVNIASAKKSKKVKKEIDIHKLKEILTVEWKLPLDKVAAVVIEKVGAMPDQGVTSMFTFGNNYGAITGAFKWCCSNALLIRPMPKVWQKELFGQSSDNKKIAIDYVKKKFPKLSLLRTERCRTDHDGMADAVCLALYGRLCLEQSK